MKTRWKKISITCGVIGLLCIVAAGLFAFYNMYDDSRAASELKEETALLETLVLSPERARERAAEKQREEILRVYQATEAPAPTVPPTTAAAETTPDTNVSAPTPAPTPTQQYMPTVKVHSEDFVAILSIPVLDLELGVRDECTKEGLKKSPCRYVGSVYTDDLIVCAHNYSSHFGRLKEL